MALLQEIRIPLLSVNDTSLTIVELNFPNGHLVKKGDTIMVFETSKTTYDSEAEVDGYLQYLCEPGKDYEVNRVVARIFSEATEIQLKPAISEGPVTGTPQGADHAGFLPGVSGPWQGETLFSKGAAQLINSSGIDRNIFRGRDFVTVGDVQIAAGKKIPSGTQPVIPSGFSSPLPAAAVVGKRNLPVPDPAKTIAEKLTSGKRREIEYLGEVQSTGLTSTIHVTVETENIFGHINQSLRYLRNSLLPVILYETSRLLIKYPVLNAYFTGDGIARYKQVDIGFAIDLDKGLKVLKIKDTDKRSISSIEDEILVLSNRYLDDTLKIEDLADITFTVTDLSSESVAFFQPLVNRMNSSILGVSAIDEKLDRCILSMTFDHRVTEGKMVANFLSDLKARLESYRSDPPPVTDISCFKCSKSLEEDLAGTGFVKCVTPQGKDGYICQACLKGF